LAEESTDTGRLEDLLGHRFRDRRLRDEALTHASARDGHNERLEFLGDAVLNLVVARDLYARFPEAREGRLTEWKSRLIARETLARVGARLGLGTFLQVGGGLESRSSLPRSLLGNALEALLGAIYLDLEPEASLEYCARLVRAWLAPELERLADDAGPHTAKQLLQHHAQSVLGMLPAYEVVDSYAAHPESRAFKVVARLGQRAFPAAWSSTKKDAERRAAWEAICVLREEGSLPKDAGGNA